MEVNNKTVETTTENQQIAESESPEQALSSLIAERHESTTRMLEADSDCV